MSRDSDKLGQYPVGAWVCPSLQRALPTRFRFLTSFSKSFSPGRMLLDVSTYIEPSSLKLQIGNNINIGDLPALQAAVYLLFSRRTY